MQFRIALKLHMRLIAGSLLLLLVIASCQGTPPTQYLLEVTREVTVVVVVTATPESGTPAASLETPATPATPVATHGTQTPEPTPDPFPTPIVNQIIVAEQLFEHGRMFWLQPIQRIWILIDGDSANSGRWLIRDDTWQEGMPEFDPSISPPDGLFQPERGFGKLWRENPSIREALGWAVEPEFGHVTTYTYTFGGEIDASGQYVAGPGYHTLVSRYGGTYIFSEVDGTWRVAATNADQ